MPPKPKADIAKPADKQRLAWAEAEVQSLQRLLDIKAHEVRQARTVVRDAGASPKQHKRKHRGVAWQKRCMLHSQALHECRGQSRLQAWCSSLRARIIVTCAQAAEARHAERAWRKRAEEAEAQLEQLKADMLDVSADIKRQSEVLVRHACVTARYIGVCVRMSVCGVQ